MSEVNIPTFLRMVFDDSIELHCIACSVVDGHCHRLRENQVWFEIPIHAAFIKDLKEALQKEFYILFGVDLYYNNFLLLPNLSVKVLELFEGIIKVHPSRDCLIPLLGAALNNQEVMTVSSLAGASCFASSPVQSDIGHGETYTVNHVAERNNQDQYQLSDNEIGASDSFAEAETEEDTADEESHATTNLENELTETKERTIADSGSSSETDANRSHIEIPAATTALDHTCVGDNAFIVTKNSTLLNETSVFTSSVDSTGVEVQVSSPMKRKMASQYLANGSWKKDKSEANPEFLNKDSVFEDVAPPTKPTGKNDKGLIQAPLNLSHGPDTPHPRSGEILERSSSFLQLPPERSEFPLFSTFAKPGNLEAQKQEGNWLPVASLTQPDIPLKSYLKLKYKVTEHSTGQYVAVPLRIQVVGMSPGFIQGLVLMEDNMPIEIPPCRIFQTNRILNAYIWSRAQASLSDYISRSSAMDVDCQF